MTIDPLNPDNQVEAILDGSVDITWEGMYQESKEWISELQKETNNLIDILLTDQDFI